MDGMVADGALVGVALGALELPLFVSVLREILREIPVGVRLEVLRLVRCRPSLATWQQLALPLQYLLTIRRVR